MAYTPQATRNYPGNGPRNVTWRWVSHRFARALLVAKTIAAPVRLANTVAFGAISISISEYFLAACSAMRGLAAVEGSVSSWRFPGLDDEQRQSHRGLPWPSHGLHSGRQNPGAGCRNRTSDGDRDASDRKGYRNGHRSRIKLADPERTGTLGCGGNILMVKPIALCLEREATGDEARYVRCTARPGRKAGLAIGLDGSILWRESQQLACELWVAHDQRLVVLRPAASPPIHLERAGRGLDLPEEHAVFVLDGDELVFGAYRFRVHVHGVTNEEQPPRPLRVARGAAVAAAMALSLGCGADDGNAAQRSSGATQARVAAEPRMAESGTTGGTGSSANTRAVSGGTSSGGGTTGTAGQTIEVVPFPPN
jgi:hypothetical protein